jgi:cobalt-zinc-cadmium efflux system outer membrane protein
MPGIAHPCQMHFRTLFFLLPITLAVSRLQAETGVIITLTTTANRVRSDNPDLAAARLRVNEALGRMTQSGRLANPTLETEIEHDPRYRQRKFEIGFSQRFPITDRLRLEKAVTGTLLKSAEAEVREVERRLIAEAQQAVVVVLAIRQRRKLLTEQSSVATELSTFLGDTAKRGEGSALDAGLAKLETASLAVEMRQLDAAEVAAAGKLKPLLGLPPGGIVHVGGELAAPVVPNAGADPSRRPDFQVAKLDAFAAGQGVALEQAKRYDDIEAGLFAAAERSEDVPEGYDKEALVGLRFKIPLPLWDKNEGGIEEARAKQERKKLEAAALARSIRLEAEVTRSEMEEWAKLVQEIGGTLLPQADEQARVSDEAFRKGQGDIQTVFRSREKRLQLAGARLDALREFHLARVRHHAALGQP